MTSLVATNSSARMLLLVTVVGFVLSEVRIRLRSAGANLDTPDIARTGLRKGALRS